MVKKYTLVCIVAIKFVFTGFGEEVFTETVNGLEWTYRVVDGGAVLGGNNGARAIPTSTFGAITIPDTLGGYTVTSIGDEAFADCNTLTFVMIPNGVTNIGERAFQNCSGLMKIDVPDGVLSIGGMAFYCCSGMTKVSLPDSLINMGDGVFPGCSSLTDVLLPVGMNEIPSGTFSGDGQLVNIEIPESVTNIGRQAFYDCSNLAHVNLPNDLMSIGAVAFHNSGLRDLYVPGRIKTLGDGAFECLFELTNVVLQTGVPYISNSMFRECEKLKHIECPDSVTSIGNGAFSECYGLQSVSLQYPLITIGNFAFRNCNLLSNAIIPANVQIVGGYAFKDCTNLKSVKFLGNAPIVDEITFENVNADCTAYVSRSSGGWNVDIPGKWMGINIDYFDPAIYTVVFNANGGSLGDAAGEVAFGEGETLKNLPVPVRDGYVFAGWHTDSSAGEKVNEGTVVTSSMTLYAHWQEATPVLTIEDGVLVSVALNGATSIVIPDGVRAIAGNAFAYCDDLEDVLIPDSVESIPFAAFGGCDKLWTKWYKVLANASAHNEISLSVTNVVLHYVTQSVPSEAVTPPTNESGFVSVISEVSAGSAIAISSEWTEQYPDFKARFGNDFTKAITMQTGKMDGWGKPMMVWQDFVAGTDPTNPNDKFTASITFDKDTNDPVISWSPELSPMEAAKRTYKKYGKVRLNDANWTEIGDSKASAYNFFKVSVEMK